MAEEEEEGQGEEEEEEGGGPPKAKSITDMIPEQLRPLAMGGVLVGTLYMLVSNLLTIEAALMWTRPQDMADELKLKKQAPQLQDQLAALVVSAFEDAGIRRDNYLKVLAAVLAAIGSAQGFVRVFQSDEGKGVAHVSSPLVRLISQANGHMIWYVVSFALGLLGHYDRTAVLYMRPPAASSPWYESGLRSGKVCASLAGATNYTVSVKMDFGDGHVVSDSKSYNLTLYQGSSPGTLRQKDLIADIQASLIKELPELNEMFSAMEKLPSLLKEDGKEEEEEEGDGSGEGEGEGEGEEEEGEEKGGDEKS